MATFIKVDGSEREIIPANGTDFSLAELQLLVGGYIQVLRLPSGGWLVVDEDGKAKKKERNERGTLLGVSAGIAPGDCVVGNVVVLNSKELK